MTNKPTLLIYFFVAMYALHIIYVDDKFLVYIVIERLQYQDGLFHAQESLKKKNVSQIHLSLISHSVSDWSVIEQNQNPVMTRQIFSINTHNGLHFV